MLDYEQGKGSSSSSRNGLSAANELPVDDHLLCGDDAPCIRIRKRVSGLSRAKRDQRYLVIIQLFLDESGYGQTGPHEAFVFAGFFGSVRTWENFAHKWEALLKRPPILTAKGFKTLLRRKRTSDRVVEFVKVLNDSGVYRISVCIPRKAYEKAVLAEVPRLRRLGLTEDAHLVDPK